MEVLKNDENYMASVEKAVARVAVLEWKNFKNVSRKNRIKHGANI